MELPNMLSYALAIAVAISSLVLFFTAFLMSHIHRKDDFFWSAVGLIYALVLWYCARNITGAVLLGQAAATALIISYCWQTIKLRRAIANPAKAAEINNFSILQSINGLLKSKKPKAASVGEPVKTPPKVKVTEQEIAIPDRTSTTSSENPVKTPKKPPVEIADAPVSDKELGKNEQSTTENKIDTVAESAIDAAAISSTKNSLSEAPQNSLLDKSTEANSVAQTTQQKEAAQENKLKNKENIESKPASAVESEPQAEIEQSFASTPIVEPVLETVEIPQRASFDSLETVEVAEVLEAIPEDGTSDRDSDPSNVIEVTTTEISITTEVKQVEPDREKDSESNDT